MEESGLNAKRLVVKFDSGTNVGHINNGVGKFHNKSTLRFDRICWRYDEDGWVSNFT